jgi:acetyl esterase/lipase
MQPTDYPQQEPLPEFAKPYADEVLNRASGIPCKEFSIGIDPYQSLSIFEPASTNGQSLVFIHGGGWTCGYKEWNSFMAPIFTDAGFLFVTIGYRLAPQHVFPAGLDDCAAAITWLFHNIGNFGGDPNAIFVGGHSAGGHYAALLALTREWKERQRLPADVISGCLPISGTYYFGKDSGLSIRPRFLGPPELGNDNMASPMQYLDSPATDFLLAFGSADFPHLKTQAQNFSQTLEDHHHDVSIVEIDEANHLEAHLATGVPENKWSLAAMSWMSARA